MRFIYKILIGLVIFNGVLITLSNFFPGSAQDVYAVDVTESDTISASTEEKYGGQITEARAKTLYVMFKSM